MACVSGGYACGRLGGSVMQELLNCPKCGSRPSLRLARNRQHKTEYGFCCSNPKCSWSYAWTGFLDKEDAVKNWNRKSEDQEYLNRESEKLLPCSCGGKAFLVYESWARLGNGWFVRCSYCQKLQTATDSKDKAIEAWNRRVSES